MSETSGLVKDRLHEAIAAVLATDDGRRVVFWLLSICGLYEDGFTGDDALTNYRLGRQAVGKQILAQMNAIDGELYPRFLMECARMRQEAVSGEDTNRE